VLEDKSAQLQELQERQRRFKTEASYVEHVAHELGLAHPGEKVFRISERASAPLPAPAQSPRIKLN
jgi:cell division protein FtsB